jgi:L-seryl-tRNA(Ser) seleniumtransferase
MPYWEPVGNLAAAYGRRPVADAVREAIDEVRRQLLAQPALDMEEPAIQNRIVAAAKGRLEAVMKPYYRQAVNATGIILHTGLGRAVLPAKALDQIQQTLQSYSLIQVDRETGKRSRRDERIEWLLRRLTARRRRPS